MEQLVSEFANQSINDIDIDNDIDMLCDKISSSEIEYDEIQELEECLSIKSAGRKVLLKTQERYEIYISGIEIWEIDDISYYHIKDNIVEYLSIPLSNKEYLIMKLKLMRKIDKQIMKMIQTHL